MMKTKVLFQQKMKKFQNKVKIRVWGDYALFSIPIYKAEPRSYPFINPSSCIGILSSIYWNPGMRWVIDKIKVINPIDYESIAKKEIKGFCIDKETIRMYTYLRNVEYIIEAHIELLNEEDNIKKHYYIFKQRCKNGRYFKKPYFGLRECLVNFEWMKLDDDIRTRLNKEHGNLKVPFMLHSNISSKDKKGKYKYKERFFDAVMKNGIIDVANSKIIEKDGCSLRFV